MSPIVAAFHGLLVREHHHTTPAKIIPAKTNTPITTNTFFIAFLYKIRLCICHKQIVTDGLYEMIKKMYKTTLLVVNVIFEGHARIIIKSPANLSTCRTQRRERDSNPRYLSVRRFSRPVQSTTLPSLLTCYASHGRHIAVLNIRTMPYWFCGCKGRAFCWFLQIFPQLFCSKGEKRRI